jgi:hypothetical protein
MRNIISSSRVGEVKDIAHSVKQYFQIAWYVKGVIRRSDDQAVGSLDFSQEHVPVIGQRAVLLSVVEAADAADTWFNPVISQTDDLGFGAGLCRNLIQEPIRRRPTVLLPAAAEDTENFHGVSFAIAAPVFCLAS